MRNQPETKHAYNIPRLHWWFFGSSLLLLGCCLLMVWTDYSGGELKWLGLRGDRGWKQYQREFYTLEKQRLAADAKAAEIRANEAGFTKQKENLVKAEEALAADQAEITRLTAAAEKLRQEEFLITRQFTMEKATRDEVRSNYEAALERNRQNPDSREVEAALRTVRQQNALVDELDLEKQKADAKVAAADAKLQATTKHRDELDRSVKRMQGNIDLVTKRLAQLKDPLLQAVVNAPVIEFAAPTIKVEQIETANHHVDVNFATVPRVDRCITCHKAMDRKDTTPDELAWRSKNKIESIEWSQQPQPLTSHPKLDLFVGENSPHPAGTFGCTVCHWGWDRETDFSRASHTPNTTEKLPHIRNDKTGLWTPLGEDDEPPKGVKPVEMTQHDAWVKNYDWKHQEFNTQPMRENKFVEASCLKCHTEQTNLAGGEKLDHGRRLIEQLGCWSCHKMEQLESHTTHQVKLGEDFTNLCETYDVDPDEVRRLNNLPKQPIIKPGQELNIPIRTLRKVGPNLAKISAKTTKDWTRKWLDNPVDFHANTYMPRYWGLENNVDSPDRNNIEMNAITEFLFTVSEPVKYPAPPVAGDIARGKELVAEVGCMGCHVIDEKLTSLKPPANLAKYMDAEQYRRYRSQGPQLGGAGSKTDRNWLYAWLKNPKQYHPKTKMPDLRLSDQEAADAAEYLVSLRQDATDQKTLPAIKSHVLDDVTLEYLQITLPAAQAQEKISKLDDLIESYFVDEDTSAYYTEPTRLVREETRLATLRKKAEEEFDDEAGREADKLDAVLKKVKATMTAAKTQVAGLNQVHKQNVYLGGQLINRYGCYACHNIRGFENAKPIGAELSEWGSKALNKLDFGLLHLEHSREAWLTQKLKAPRSYDTGRVGITRKPQELLKMPQFNLTPAQREQIVTVVVGMTAEKLTPNEPQQLTPAEFQIERGRWLVKENNCQGCHIVEGRGGAIRATGIPAGMEPPLVSGTPTQLRQGQRTNPDWLFHFLKAPPTGQVRPWLKSRMPTFGFSDAEANVLVRYFALEGNTPFPYKTPKHVPTAEELAVGKKLFEGLSCAKCHIVEGKALGKPLAEIAPEDLGQLAPNMNLAHERLQRDWLVNKWMVDPLSQQPGTRMPQFDYGVALPAKILPPEVLGGDARKRIEALVDYVLSLGAPVNIETPVASEKKQPKGE